MAQQPGLLSRALSMSFDSSVCVRIIVHNITYNTTV
jgi:hypothetical protein